MQIVVVQQPARRLACVRHIGPYHGIGQAFGRLDRMLASAPDVPRVGEMLALFHDNPRVVPAEALRSDAAVAMPDGVAVPASLVALHLPASECATLLHVGPYEQLAGAWARLIDEWLPSSGRRAADGPSYEIYLNDPGTTPKAELRTLLCQPLV